MPLDDATLAARAVRSLRTHHVNDVRDDPLLPQEGTRSRLAVPIVREGTALGVIVLSRVEVRPFTPDQIRVVETFAKQAAIAMENVRLFNETKEALERQTAISEILRVISRSPTEIQPVLDAIAENAARYCQAEDATVMLPDGPDLRAVAHYGPLPLVPGDPSPRAFAYPIDRGSLNGRAFLEGRVLHTADIWAEADEYPHGAAAMRRVNSRAGVAAPLLREGSAIGTISLRRREARPFTDRQIELVQTFADQAVIAIENVRLFNETKEALDRQTATAEVLKAIGGSALDLAGVLNTVISHATRLAAAENGFIYRADGDVLHMVAAIGEKAEIMREWQAENPIQTRDVGSATGRAFVERRSVHIPDVLADDTYTYVEAQRLGDFRTLLAVPLMREGRALGVIAMWRTEVRPFSDEQIRLVESFADQAVIAIENARLFNETKEALEQQTATAELLKVISSSTTDVTPVFRAVVENAVALCEADNASILRRDGDMFRYVAHAGAFPGLDRFMSYWGDFPLRAERGTLSGRVLLEGRTVQIEDIDTDAEYEHKAQKVPGSRTHLGVPLLRNGEAVGLIIARRSAVRPFADRHVRLLETFADQAVIAIENVRLFNEIQEKSRQLEIAGRHKSEFLANMSHELRTPLNAIIGFSEVLLQGMFGALNEKQREYQQDVLSSGRLLLSLINDILDLSKVEAGRVELELGEFSLPAALENGVTMIRERASRHGIRVEIDVEGVDRIVADERKVKQIVANLLSNAVKFTPDGGRVDVRAVRENGEVRVAVRDTGIGIDVADRERIFEEFQQASRDPERSREGTGLGLALSKRYVELHGGRIWVESEVGRGSTFTFALPLRPEGKAG